MIKIDNSNRQTKINQHILPMKPGETLTILTGAGNFIKSLRKKLRRLNLNPLFKIYKKSPTLVYIQRIDTLNTPYEPPLKFYDVFYSDLVYMPLSSLLDYLIKINLTVNKQEIKQLILAHDHYTVRLQAKIDSSWIATQSKTIQNIVDKIS